MCQVTSACPTAAGLQPARATAEKGRLPWHAAAAAKQAKTHSVQELVLQYVSQVSIVAHAPCLLAEQLSTAVVGHSRFADLLCTPPVVRVQHLHQARARVPACMGRILWTRCAMPLYVQCLESRE